MRNLDLKQRIENDLNSLGLSEGAQKFILTLINQAYIEGRIEAFQESIETLKK